MAEAIPTRKKHTVFDIDDGGSFDRLVEETRWIVRMRGGSEAEATDLLQCRVLEAFVGRFRKNRKGVNKRRAPDRRPKSKKAHCFGAETEKKWELEGNSDKAKTKKGPMISIKRKRVLGNSEGNCESKKLKTSSEKMAGKRICLTEKESMPKAPSELDKRIKGKGGRDIQLVIKKKLTKTDLSTHQGRLLIPLKQMRKDACFLTEEEEAILSSEEKGSNEIRVMVMEPCGVDSAMVMVKWNMQQSKNYGLRTGWNKAIERNHEEIQHLAVDQFIQLWSFRVASQLWFAIDVEAPSPSSSDSRYCNAELEDQSTVED